MSSIGEQLREAREARGMTTSEAAAATRIKVQHIESIERDDFSQFAAATYARGFIRIYADCVGVSPGPLLEEYLVLHSGSAAGPVLSEDRTPSRRREAAADGPAEESPGAVQGRVIWLLKHVVLPVVGIVAMVLLVSRLLGGGSGDDAQPPAGASSPAHRPMLVAEPPEPYLAPDASPEDTP